MRLLLSGLVILYLCCGILFLALPQRRRLAPLVRRAPSFVLALGSLLLLGQIGQPPSLEVRWIPLVEPAALEHGAMAIYISVMVCWALCWAHFSDVAASPPEKDTGFWTGLSYIACGVAIAALTVNQFIVRVALLDVLALAVLILLVLYALPSVFSLKALQQFLLLRLGDLALLFMVLVLWRFSGTFHIDTALSATTMAAPGQRALLLFSGLLAVGVKMGVPPFDSWVRTTTDLPWGMGTWVVGATLPLLGAYLLYRLQILLISPYVLGALALLGVLYVVMGIGWLGREGTERSDRFVAALTIHGGLGLLLCGTGAMGAYVLSFLPLRMVLGWVWRSRQLSVSMRAEPAPRPLNGLTRVNRAVAMRTGPLLETSSFNRVIDRVMEGVLRFGGLLQRAHTGQLHTYVLWVTVVLVGVVLSAALLALSGGV